MKPFPLVNAHTHLYSGLAPFGLPVPNPPPQTFRDILKCIWWRLDRALDHESLRVSAEYYLSEAQRLGCAGLCDHHESPNAIAGSLDVLADACQRQRIPAVLTYGVTERNGGLEEARLGLEECRRFVRENRRPYVRGMVGVHAPFTVSDETLRAAGELARELGTGIHMHVAEDRSDGVDARERGDAGVVDRLARCACLVPGSVFAHGVFLSPEEVRMLDTQGIWLVQNPRSNLNNKVGYPRALAQSRRVALGTDGFPADLRAEESCLLEQAPRAGEDEVPVRRRLAASSALFAELFGGEVPEPGLPGEPDERERITGEAAAVARTLFARMQRDG